MKIIEKALKKYKEGEIGIKELLFIIDESYNKPIKTYGFSRRIQLKNYIKSAHGFESAEFSVAGLEDKKEAVKEVMDWFKEFVKEANTEANDTRTSEEKFSDSLDEDKPREQLTKKEDEARNGLPKKEKK